MMWLLQQHPAQIYTYLLDIAFNEDATYIELVTLAFAIGVFWMITLETAKPIIRYFTYDKPWLRQAMEREFERSDKKQLEQFGQPTSKEEYIEKSMKDWPGGIAMCIQHVAGALLCLPLLLGQGDQSWAASLACCGGLSETGFDLLDTARYFYIRFFTKDGKKKLPTTMLVLLVLHHSLSVTLVPSMIMRYRYLRAFHWLVFELQIAGGLTIIGVYSQLLDISQPGDLRQFKALNTFFLAFMVWSRLIHWFLLCYEIMMIWFNDQAWALMAVGGAIVFLFSIFNVLICIIPTYQRWKKFRHKSAGYESLPAEASEKQRRQSMFDLQAAADDLLLEESLNVRLITDDRIRLFLDGRNEGNAKRRHTMPPRKKLAQWGSTRLVRGFSVPANVWKGN